MKGNLIEKSKNWKNKETLEERSKKITWKINRQIKNRSREKLKVDWKVNSDRKRKTVRAWIKEREDKR